MSQVRLGIGVETARPFENQDVLRRESTTYPYGLRVEPSLDAV